MTIPRSPVWVDAQLPPALARWLRDLGESGAVHVEGGWCQALGYPLLELPVELACSLLLRLCSE